MLTFAQKYGRNVYSQYGEDGIIEEIINRIQPKKLSAVEFGAPTWEYCSNTAYLADKGWQVHMYDTDPHDPKVIRMEITPENVSHVVGIPTVLSIDCDGPDYHIWNAYKWKPEVVLIEINSSFDPTSFVIPGPSGASYFAMVWLGKEKGYKLICHTGNLIWVDEKYADLFPEIIGDPLNDHRLYFNRSWL
jgi:hypothetical protein